MEISKSTKQLFHRRPVTVWLTGLSGSGKSTIAFGFEQRLKAAGYVCYVLDGDCLRKGLNRDLGFSPDDRRENIRRVAEVARMFNEAGLIVIVAFIAPYRDDRRRAREVIGQDRFIEVHVNAPLEVCEQRDPKGLYRKARAGLIPDFTGISAPYEVPQDPALRLDTAQETAEASVVRFWDFFQEMGG